MATMTTLSPPRHPIFTNQERHTLRQLGAMVGSLDYWRRHCADLERRLAGCPEGPRRHQLIRDLFAARQAEEAATLDLRDGVCHLTGLVRPTDLRIPKGAAHVLERMAGTNREKKADSRK